MAADKPHPPGRLRAEAGLGHQQIMVPANLRVLGLIYWSVCLLSGLGGAAVSVFSEPEPEKLSLLLAVVVLVALLFFAWRFFGALLHWSNRSRVGAVGGPLVLIGLISVPLFLAGAPLGGYAIVAVGVAFYWWVARCLARPATLTIDQANLTIAQGRHSRVVPLEDIHEVVRTGPWWRSQALLGAARVPVLTGLSDKEWAWLSTRIRDEAHRRRRQLAQSGHDLQQPAAPPPDLQQLRAAQERP